MVKTYIKNSGITETILLDNNKKHFTKLNWDANYDGNEANININTNTDGIIDSYDIKLDNNDLIKILNIPSINTQLDKRLEMDFEDIITPKGREMIELPGSLTLPYLLDNKKDIKSREKRTSKIIDDNIFTHLSSPRTNEEFIVPIPLNESPIIRKSNSNRKIKRKKYKTRKIYKKPSSSLRNSSSLRTSSSLRNN